MSLEQNVSDLWDEYREFRWDDCVMKTKIVSLVRESIQQHLWEKALNDAWTAGWSAARRPARD